MEGPGNPLGSIPVAIVRQSAVKTTPHLPPSTRHAVRVGFYEWVVPHQNVPLPVYLRIYLCVCMYVYMDIDVFVDLVTHLVSYLSMYVFS